MNGKGSAFGGRSIDSDRLVRRSVCVFCSSACVWWGSMSLI